MINEVLTNTAGALGDRIELYNTTVAPVNVGGWYLSDSWGWDWDLEVGDYKKYQFPANTTIPGGGYLVLNESVFNLPGDNPKDFTLSGPHGGELWLMEADANGNLTRFADHVEFGPAAAEESFGLWPNGQGELFPTTGNTFGADNSGPRFGPLVISEVMYHPTPPTPDDLLAVPDLTERRPGVHRDLQSHGRSGQPDRLADRERHRLQFPCRSHSIRSRPWSFCRSIPPSGMPRAHW